MPFLTEFREFAYASQSNVSWPVFLSTRNKALDLSQTRRKHHKDKVLLNMEQIVPGANFCRLTFQKLILVRLSLIKLPVKKCLSSVKKKPNVSVIYRLLWLDGYGGKLCQNKSVFVSTRKSRSCRNFFCLKIAIANQHLWALTQPKYTFLVRQCFNLLSTQGYHARMQNAYHLIYL